MLLKHGMCATWLWWMCCLPGPVEALDGRGPCRLMTKSISGSVYQAGDVVIGGLFPVHVRAPEPEVKFQWKQVNSSCTTFNQRAYRWLQTMIFAVEEINQNPAILPGITLGYMAADTCLAESTTLATALTMVTGVEASLENTECGLAPDVPVIIGDMRNSASILADTLGVFDIPMVSYLASCLCVNENRRYPNFFRTMPSNMLQAQAMARLLQLLGWTWVGLVSADDDYGRYGIQMLMQELKGTGVCVAYNEVVPKNYPVAAVTRIAETIQMSSARVVLTFVIDQVAKVLIEEVVRQNITDKQWIANDAWAAFATLSVPHNAPSLAGTVGFAISKSDIPGLGTFLTRLEPSLLSSGSDPFIKELWEEMFGCSLNNVPAGRSSCSGKEVIAVGGSLYADVSELRSSYNVYKAVYAVAYAIHDMLACRDGTGPSNTGRCLNVTRLKPSQIPYYLGRVNFTMPLGEQLFFDQNGYPPASYDIINWQVTEKGMMQFVNVGHFASSDGHFYLDMKNMVWGGGRREERPVSACSATCPSGTRKAFQKGMPECCFDCLPCADGKISNQTGSAECIRCPERFWSSPDRTTCIPQQVDFLSYSDAMGIVLAIISVAGATLTAATFITFLFYQHTPLVRANNSEVSFMLLISLTFCFLCALAFIGRPMAWSCMLRHTLFGISFVLCISCLLSRTVVVLVAFHSTLPGGKVMRYVGPAQQRLGISICTLVQVLICGFWLVLAPPKAAERGVRGNKGPRIIIECAMDSVVGFSLVLGYIGLLASLCLLLAFLARKLPDNFNEAKHISFSMLIFCAVWVAFVPSYISSPGKYAVAVEIFAILASSYGLLLCIFAPKCFIILLRPERNTKKHMMAR